MTDHDFVEICPNCLERCAIITVDDGIGHYEYWGARGVDIQRRPATRCCEADPVKGWFKADGVDACWRNGGQVHCDDCPASSICMDCEPL